MQKGAVLTHTKNIGCLERVDEYGIHASPFLNHLYCFNNATDIKRRTPRNTPQIQDAFLAKPPIRQAWERHLLGGSCLWISRGHAHELLPLEVECVTERNNLQDKATQEQVRIHDVNEIIEWWREKLEDFTITDAILGNFEYFSDIKMMNFLHYCDTSKI